jgi:hypothetical protein
MNVQSTASKHMNCYACHTQTDERCSYCLLPICTEHGKQVQPWYTCRVVLVCTPCQAQLEDIAQQEQSLHWAANAEQHAAVLHVLTSERL